MQRQHADVAVVVAPAAGRELHWLVEHADGVALDRRLQLLEVLDETPSAFVDHRDVFRPYSRASRSNVVHSSVKPLRLFAGIQSSAPLLMPSVPSRSPSSRTAISISAFPT